MQEIKKRRIVIASVLKPVNDTRMFEKIGETLAQNHEVHVFGFSTSEPSTSAKISVHPHRKFQRLSFRRLLTPWKLLFQIQRLNPSDLIVATHELLFQAWILKWWCGCKIYY